MQQAYSLEKPPLKENVSDWWSSSCPPHYNTRLGGSVRPHAHGNVRNVAISSFAGKQKELLKLLACPTSHNKAGAPRSQSVLC